MNEGWVGLGWVVLGGRILLLVSIRKLKSFIVVMGYESGGIEMKLSSIFSATLSKLLLISEANH